MWRPRHNGLVRVGVAGYGVEGRAAVRYWQAGGHTVTVHDRREDVVLPPGIAGHTGAGYLTGLDEVDLIVRAPGVRPDVLPAGPRVTSVVAEFLTRCPVPVVGATGTKGKGTTAAAIASIIRATGRRVFVGGNIGAVPLAFLPDLRAGDLVVLELSSFQLMDLPSSPQIAVVLAVTPDHLNWHRDLDEYHRAKASIVAHQAPGDAVVYVAEDPVATRIAGMSRGRKIGVGNPDGVHVREDGIHVGGTRVLGPGDVPLPGHHNRINVATAIAAAGEVAGLDPATIRSGVRSLSPLPHRLTVAATIGGVTYVDDSCSTTPEAAVAAMSAFDARQVLILGGSGKGAGYGRLAARVARGPVRAVILVGAEGPRIAAALEAAGVRQCERVGGSMLDVVRRAAELARPGDVVLLSPACASLGEFRDYADRGDQFASAVRALQRST